MENYNYKFVFIGDHAIKNMHHVTIEYNGNEYSVIFGKYINGGFFSIPSLRVGGELSHDFSDIFWNTESLYKVLSSKKLAKVIAMSIAEFKE